MFFSSLLFIIFINSSIFVLLLKNISKIFFEFKKSFIFSFSFSKITTILNLEFIFIILFINSYKEYSPGSILFKYNILISLFLFSISKTAS